MVDEKEESKSDRPWTSCPIEDGMQSVGWADIEVAY